MSTTPPGWRCTWVWSGPRLTARNLKPAFVVCPTEAEAKAKAVSLRALAAQQGAVVAISITPEPATRRGKPTGATVATSVTREKQT